MKMKKLLAVLLVLCFFTLPLASCGYVGTEEEVLAAAESIFTDMDTLCTVLYGEGIPPEKDEEVTNYYVYADMEWLKDKGIENAAELYSMVKSKFTFAQYELIKNLCMTYSFQSDKGTEGIDVFRDHWVKEYDDNGKVIGERYVFLVYSEHEKVIDGSNSYDLSSLAVEEIGRDYAIVSLDVTVYPPAGEEGDALLFAGEKFRLAYEDGVYKLDEVPFITYYVGEEQ